MSVRIARTLASLMSVDSPDRWPLDELNLLDVLARGLAIQRELAADDLDDLGMAAIGELFGGLAGRKAGAIEYGALNELVLLQVGDRLLDGAVVDEACSPSCIKSKFPILFKRYPLLCVLRKARTELVRAFCGFLRKPPG